jgi:hypothetical protein
VEYTIEIYSLESVVHALYDWGNPMFLGGVFPELLSN